MLSPRSFSFLAVLGLGVVGAFFSPRRAFELRKGDRICLLGNALAERMQHDGWLETHLQARFPEHELRFRNLGFGADELSVHQRVMNFGKFSDDERQMDLPRDRFVPWDRYLSRCKADVVFAFFGYNESFAGEQGLPQFRTDLERFIDHVAARRYNGRSAPRLVLFSSIPHENLRNPSLPDGTAHNARIALYTKAMADIARRKGVTFVDLFSAMRERYNKSPAPLTINGIHLNERGNDAVAQSIVDGLFGGAAAPAAGLLAKIRPVVQDKNLHWFKRYRVNDGYNVHGGRSKIIYPRNSKNPKAVSNFEVLQRELDQLEVMTANRDRRIWALARGKDVPVADDNLPPSVPVITNKPGKGPDGSHLYISGEAGVAKMKLARGMRANLFACEQQFPDLVNPVQMAWDTKGRLWVAVWPSYPNWKPGDPMEDKLLIFEDTDGDGKADKRKVFAGDLTNPTGFEFWNGGVVVAQIPDLVFLKDTDGDDKADVRERLLHGISSGDTHHSANSFVLGPGGALYFQEGTFHMSQIESIYGPVRNNNGCVWRFDPRTWRVERYVPYNFANPHGHVFDRWGQDFVTDGTGNVNYFALPFSGYIKHPAKHTRYFSFYRQRSRPSPGTEILSSRHFPEANQGNYLNANVIGFLGIFQDRIVDADSGFGAQAVESIVSSTDPNFRPSDMEIGPDGALYFLDWHNAIIGHLQHHIRDPSRDHAHGRIYRVTYEGRPLLKAPQVDGRPIVELLELLKEPEDRLRYRVRIELSERDSDAVVAAVRRWTKRLDPDDEGYEHHLLEALWVQQHHDRMDRPLLSKLLRAKDPRARAAATRVLRYMRHHVGDGLALMRRQVNDSHPRVRLEAVVGASFFDSFEATSVALEALKHPTDRFLDYALKETIRALEEHWKKGLQAGRTVTKDNPAGVDFLLTRVGARELRGLPRTPNVLQALLTRSGVPARDRNDAAIDLAKANGTSIAEEVLQAIRTVDKRNDVPALRELGKMLRALPGEALTSLREQIGQLASEARAAATRELAFASMLTIDRSVKPAWNLASLSRDGVQAFLGGAGSVEDARLRSSLYDTVRPLMFSLPVDLMPKSSGGGSPGLHVDFYSPPPRNARLATFQAQKPKSSFRSANFNLKLPRPRPDAFGLAFRGTLRVPKTGRYVFFTKSDDGSRLFIGDRGVVNNDGAHGTVEKRGSIRLKAGLHPITVTYFDRGGAESLGVSWKGPGFKKQPIPDDALGGDPALTARAAAIRAMARIPGRADEKFADATKLLGNQQLLEPVVEMLASVDAADRPVARIQPLIDTLAGHVGSLPPDARTTPQVVAALKLGKELASSLEPQAALAARKSLEGLGGTIVLVRTVPHKMLFDVKEFWVEAGKPVAIVFQNNDMMPHNFVLTAPGALQKVGAAASDMTDQGGDPKNAFIPKTEAVMWHTSMLNPGQSQRLTFVAPNDVGDHPFVCTFPGHWSVMNGTMHVVRKIDPQVHVVKRVSEDSSAPVRPFVKNWKLADLAEALSDGWAKGHSAARGKRLFTEVGCAKCHAYQGNGAVGGPDLTLIGTKYKTGKELLLHILQPSDAVLEGYDQHLFELEEDDDVLGRIIKETPKELHVLQNLQNPEDVTIVRKDQIVDRFKTQGSAMPTGLLVTLNKDEILDLLVFLRGGKK